MDDLISRQAAIDAIVNTPSEVQNKNIPLTNQYDGAAFRQIEILGILESLPSAQPATNCSEIPNSSTDCISRQAAIDAMKAMYRAAEKWLRDATDDMTKARAESCMASLVEIKLRTEKLPAAQPETQWIPCSERLPKEKQFVLVTDGSVIWVCDIISTDEGYKWEDSHGYWLDLDEWIAWMKLPELYKEGDGK